MSAITSGEEKICFFISPIGPVNSDIRKKSDEVIKFILTPVLSEVGYQIKRADHIDKPGLITNQIIQYIINSSLVIADLTGHNPNVFYELALRHAIRTPFIQIISTGETIPFDVLPTRTIEYDIHDLESVENAKNKLKNQLKSIENVSEVDSPISMAVSVENLIKSVDVQQHNLGNILTTLLNLQQDISFIKENLLKRGQQTKRERNLARTEEFIKEIVRETGMNREAIRDRLNTELRKSPKIGLGKAMCIVAKEFGVDTSLIEHI